MPELIKFISKVVNEGKETKEKILLTLFSLMLYLQIM